MTGYNDNKSASESVESPLDQDLRWTRTGFFFGAITITGLLLYTLQHYDSSARWAQLAGIIGSGLLIASASFLLGALLGFIFAIPRALQGQRSIDQGSSEKKLDASTSSERALEYQVNTNLEQISDWLTKIIVGVGLVQLGKVPDYAVRLGVYFSDSLGHVASSPAIAVTLIVAFLVFGFLAGYLITRLYVTGALKRAETERKFLVAGTSESEIPIRIVDQTTRSPMVTGGSGGSGGGKPPATD